MKAIVYTSYGPPDMLRLVDVGEAAPAEGQVRMRVEAASVNPLDWHFMRGSPRFLRLMTGLRAPKEPRLGVDVAGVVEAVGPRAARFRPGDAVFGTCRGAFGESVCAAETALEPKPENVTFEKAAACPIAGFTALQALRDKGRLQPGQSVLINGAAGGVGTFAVQIAKSFGATVTGVCSGPNVERVRSLGADRVIDYTQEDYTLGSAQYDVLIDCVGNRPFAVCRRVLAARGIYVGVGGSGESVLEILAQSLHAGWLSLFDGQRIAGLLARSSPEDLRTLARLLRSGEVTPLIDRSYPLSQTAEALRYLETGHARGKVVIQVR